MIHVSIIDTSHTNKTGVDAAPPPTIWPPNFIKRVKRICSSIRFVLSLSLPYREQSESKWIALNGFRMCRIIPLTDWAQNAHSLTGQMGQNAHCVPSMYRVLYPLQTGKLMHILWLFKEDKMRNMCPVCKGYYRLDLSHWGTKYPLHVTGHIMRIFWLFKEERMLVYKLVKAISQNTVEFSSHRFCCGLKG